MAFATRLCGIAIAALRIFSVDDGWRTSQVPKANIIAQSITIFDFIKAVCFVISIIIDITFLPFRIKSTEIQLVANSMVVLL